MLRDGLHLHRSALARGFDVFSLPRQVLLVTARASGAETLSFTQGVPGASTLSALTFTHDKRIRRSLWQRAGLPIPPGATFSSLGVDDAFAYADRIGYPLVLKAALGENPSQSIVGISNEDELGHAFAEMRRRCGSVVAPARSRELSGYAQTIMDRDEDDDGESIATVSTRFLLEQCLEGRYLRVFVCGRKVLAAVAGGPQDAADVLAGMHPSIGRLAVDAVDCIPGLALASVHLIVESPAMPVEDQVAVLVELCERPELHAYERADLSLGPQLGDAVLDLEAGCAGATVPPARDRVLVEARLHGLLNAAAMRPELEALCREHHTEASITDVDEVGGSLGAVVEGEPGALAQVFESVMQGDRVGQQVDAIDERIASGAP